MSESPDRERAAGLNAAKMPESGTDGELSTWAAHLRAVVWLRWKLSQRRWHRKGRWLRGMGVLAAGLAVVMGCLSFLLALGLGVFLLPKAEPVVVLITWGVLIVFFVAFRLCGVITSLQRGEGLPLDNLLHLPFASHQVFLLNFSLSQLTLSTVILVPALVGLAIASTVALDFGNVVLIPASLALVLCVSAVLYQVQGWIASAVATRPRRVLVGSLLGMALLLLSQVPGLYSMHQLRQERASQQEMIAAEATPSDHVREDTANGQAGHATREETGASNRRLPRGWVAYGSADGPESTPWLSAATMVGLLAIATLSLWRSYRATLARYRDGHPRAARPRHATASRQRRRWPVRKSLVSPVAAIARVTLRQWLRSVQGKLLLLSPLMVAFLSVFLWVHFPRVVDSDMLPLTAIAVMTLVGAPPALFCNLFAFDGQGFCLYRFAGVPARTLVLGKCLALVPVFVTLAGAVLAVATLFGSMAGTHVLATVFQAGIAFLACCMLGSALSIHLPYAVSYTSMTRAGSSSAGLAALLGELAVLALLILIAERALAIEDAFQGAGFPVYLALSMFEFGVLVVGFRVVLDRLARQLVKRSDRIVDAVTVID